MCLLSTLLATRTDSNASQLSPYISLEIFTQANGVNFGHTKFLIICRTFRRPCGKEDLIIWRSTKFLEARTSHRQTYLVGDVSNGFIDLFRVPEPEQSYGAKEPKK